MASLVVMLEISEEMKKFYAAILIVMAVVSLGSCEKRKSFGERSGRYRIAHRGKFHRN